MVFQGTLHEMVAKTAVSKLKGALHVMMEGLLRALMVLLMVSSYTIREACDKKETSIQDAQSTGAAQGYREGAGRGESYDKSQKEV